MNHSKAIERITKNVALLSVLSESEKIFGHGAIREHLPEALKWPFIYTSDFLPAIIAGGVAGSTALGVERLTRSAGRHKMENADYSWHRFGAMAAGVVLASYPTVIGVELEMKPHCDTSSERQVLACKPDPVDAGTIIIGNGLGLAYAFRRREEVAVT